jgi:hypothetical protein
VGLFLYNVFHLSGHLSRYISGDDHLPVIPGPNVDVLLPNQFAGSPEPYQPAGSLQMERDLSSLNLRMEVPIMLHMDSTDQPMLELCSMDYAAYHKHPEKFPMAADLEMKYCRGHHTRRRKLSEILKASAQRRRLEEWPLRL